MSPLFCEGEELAGKAARGSPHIPASAPEHRPCAEGSRSVLTAEPQKSLPHFGASEEMRNRRQSDGMVYLATICGQNRGPNPRPRVPSGIAFSMTSEMITKASNQQNGILSSH